MKSDSVDRRAGQGNVPVVAVEPVARPAGNGAASGVGHHVLLYDRALHPDLLAVRLSGRNRRTAQMPRYAVEAWAMAGQHMVRFCPRSAARGALVSRSLGGGAGAVCACELLTNRERSPGSGVVAAFSAAGEREYEQVLSRLGIRYMCSVLSETLGEGVFRGVVGEFEALAREPEAAWARSDDGGLSVVRLFACPGELRVEAYHAMPRGRSVVRSQSIFELMA